MDGGFGRLVEALHPSFLRLMEMPPQSYSTLRDVPRRGVYLLSEAGEHLYVGRSNDIRGRLGRHCLPGASHRMAAFAFRLAREATGNTKASYRKEGSRAALMADEMFREAFDLAKARIRRMEMRFVEEVDPTRQALLEIYCAVALRTPYNDFDNH